jgi:predicted alpha/beta hydrolase family esterase
MKNAIILHGKPSEEEYYDLSVPSPSNHHWLPWLQHQLLAKGVLAQTPELPRPFHPEYDPWREEFERLPVSPETILVGHSRGGGFLIRWLSEHSDVRVGKVVLVAPSIIPEDEDDINKRRFLEFEIDSQLSSRTKGLEVFYSDDDMPKITQSVNALREKIAGIKFREFKGYKHFCLRDLGTEEFPELLEACLS